MIGARVRFLVLLSLALGASGSALAAQGFEHHAFAANTMRPSHVLVLPPRSEIIRARLVDATSLIKETALLESSCAESVAGALDTLGYDGDARTLAPDVLAADRALLELVTTFQDRVDELVGVAVSAPKDVREGRFTIGEEVLPLASRTKADGFLIVQAQAIIPSKGRRTLSAFLQVLGGAPPIPPTNTTRGIAVLIDGRTGDLAWLAGGEVGGAVAKEPDVVGARLGATLMRSYPAAGVIHEPKKKKKGKGGETEPAPSVPQVAGESTDDTEAVLAAFESAAKEAESQAPPAEGETPPSPGETPPSPGETPPSPGEPAPAPVEDVPIRDDFQQDPNAPVGTPVETTPGSRPAPAPASPEELAAIRKMWEAPEASRPQPTRQVVLQMLDGGPSLVVRNMSEPAVRVSVDLGGWVTLEPLERRGFDVAKGSHRILVVNTEGVEVARVSCLVNATSLASAEIWPRL